MGVRVHLIDGTYELFRHYYAVPSSVNADGREVGAVAGVVGNVLTLLEGGATHVGVATDKVIESFRNDLWVGYKTGEGVDPVLKQQFPLLEEALEALGVRVWAMVDLEADDALASAAVVAAEDDRVEQVQILTPDKDLGQCVGGKVVQVDRRKRTVIDVDGVTEKFGVPPESIPDYLALVGDSADGFPGIPGFGAKTAAAVLRRYGHVEEIPDAAGQWDVAGIRGVPKLAATLAECREAANLFKVLATLRIDRSLLTDVDELRWTGPTPELPAVAKVLDEPAIVDRADRLARARQT